MRRQSTKRSAVVKAISTTALVAALTAGTIPVYATETAGPTERWGEATHLIVEGHTTLIPISELALPENDSYRQALIAAFTGNLSIKARVEGAVDDLSEELSKDITLTRFQEIVTNQTDPAHEPREQDTIIVPYTEDED